VKVWIDMTASAHVLVFRPLIQILRGRGDAVEITAREYAQTLQLLELHRLQAEVIGRHGGRSRLGKARALTSRLGCRAATKVVVPEAIPPERLARYGARPPKLLRYEGLKEEYYLADFEPDASVLEPFALDPARVLIVLRPPPDVSLYHRTSNPLFPQTLDYVGSREDVHAIVLPRTEEQREFVRGLDLPSVIVPERAVDAQSLIALADLVVSAGGTMNREAAALGVPVYTTYAARLGGVDEMLIRDGRLVPLTDPRALRLEKRDAAAYPRLRRNPHVMLDLLLRARGERA
jgi:predicted glycosyltransferase